MADWYVSASGNDTTGTGASGAPYLTINKVQSVGTSGDTIYVNPGTYGAWNVSKSFTMRPWPGTTGHILFTGDPGNTYLCQINAATTFAILGTSRQHFQFTNENTTLPTGSPANFALYVWRPPSTTADNYLFEYIDILNTARVGMRIIRPQGVTIRHLFSEHCGNGLSLYNSQDEGQGYGAGITLEDCWFRDMDSMVRNAAAASDYGGVAVNLERVSGTSAQPITIKRLRTERCYAVRMTGGSYQEEFDGAGLEFFGSRYVLVDGWDSVDDKNCIETGTQEFGDGSPAHAKETTLASGVSIGGKVLTTAANRDTGEPGWRVGDCIYVDTAGTQDSMIIDAISGTTVTCHRAGTASSGFAANHSAGVRISPAMPMDNNVFRNVRAYATGTRLSLGGFSTDGYIRGALVPFMQDTRFEFCTFRGFDQFAVAMATPIGNDFPGSVQNITFRDCIFDSPGGTDAKGNARKLVVIDDPAVSTDAFDHNTWYSRHGSTHVYVRWGGSDKTSWAATQAVGIEANGSNVDALFVDGDVAYLSSTSPMIGIGTTAMTDSTRVLEGNAFDRGGHERLLVEDRFWRTTTGDMGTASDGQAWDEDSGAASCDVADGVLTMAIANGGTVRANIATGITNCETLFRFRFSADPDTAGTVKVYPTFKHTDDTNSHPGIRVETNLNTSQALGLAVAELTSLGADTPLTGGAYTAVTRETWAAHQWFWSRSRCTETGGVVSIKSRIWADGTTEPVTWDIGPATTSAAHVVGSGAVGLRANQSSGNTASIDVDVADYIVYSVTPEAPSGVRTLVTRTTAGARSAAATRTAAAARAVV
jgi:hypothetical protein